MEKINRLKFLQIVFWVLVSFAASAFAQESDTMAADQQGIVIKQSLQEDTACLKQYKFTPCINGKLDKSHIHKQEKFLVAQAYTKEPSVQTNSGGQKQSGGYTPEQIAEMIKNPLGYLWLLFIQNDTTWYNGDIPDRLGEGRSKPQNSFLVQPVLSMQFTQGWRWILRPVIPINSYRVPTGFTLTTNQPPPSDIDLKFERKTGLGDIVLLNAFSTNEGAKPPNIVGAGLTTMFNTATEDVLGTGKWSAGPAGLALHIGEKWMYGVIAQHFWSFAGDDNRADVNLTDIQPIIRYLLTQETSIGMQPNWRYNWERDEWAQIPLGLGFDTMIKLGPVPTKIGLEFYYHVERPDELGPEWQIRFLLTPVVPAPAWSRKPLF